MGPGPTGLAPRPLVRVSESSQRAVGALWGIKEEREMTCILSNHTGRMAGQDGREVGGEGVEAERPGRRPRRMFDGINYQVP